MIYMEPKGLGWKCLLESWLNTLPPLLNVANRNLIRILFYRFSSPLLWLVEYSGKAKVRQCPEYYSCKLSRDPFINSTSNFQQMYVTSRSNLIKACMQIYDTFMDDFFDEKYVEAMSDLDIRAQLEVIYIYYLVKNYRFLHPTVVVPSIL